MQSRFDRQIFEQLAGPFEEWPIIICPSCRRTSLEASVDEFESAISLDARDFDEWEPDWVSGYFHGRIECPRIGCDNRYIVAGMWTLDSTDDTTQPPTEGIARFYSAQYMLPGLPLMDFPDAAPEIVREMAKSAGAILLVDPSAAANRIRSAIEALLDHQRIRKTSPRDKTRRLTTHARIEIFRAKNQQAADHLMAMKWIGNVGSHERNPLPLGWVLDGMEHFARAVELVYDPTANELERRAKMINKKGSKLRPKTNGKT